MKQILPATEEVKFFQPCPPCIEFLGGQTELPKFLIYSYTSIIFYFKILHDEGDVLSRIALQ